MIYVNKVIVIVVINLLEIRYELIIYNLNCFYFLYWRVLSNTTSSISID